MSSGIPTVFCRNLQDYNRAQIKATIEQSINEMDGVAELLGKAKKVLLKPNLLQPSIPSKAVTTHPEVIMATVEWLLEMGISVSIADSPAFGTAEGCIRKLGIWEELVAGNVDVFTFRRNKKFKTIGNVDKYTEFSISSELDDFDAAINLPKLKSHCQMQFTGATKNLFGCLAGKRKIFRHMMFKNNKVMFAQMLLENADYVNPVLNIADGIQAMHGNGPRSGEPFPLNKIMVSDDHLALDWVFCKMIGIKPEDSYLFKAVEKKPEYICKGDAWGVANGFVHAEEIELEFHPVRMIGSVIKDQYRKIKG